MIIACGVPGRAHSDVSESSWIGFRGNFARRPHWCSNCVNDAELAAVCDREVPHLSSLWRAAVALRAQ